MLLKNLHKSVIIDCRSTHTRKHGSTGQLQHYKNSFHVYINFTSYYRIIISIMDIYEFAIKVMDRYISGLKNKKLFAFSNVEVWIALHAQLRTSIMSCSQHYCHNVTVSAKTLHVSVFVTVCTKTRLVRISQYFEKYHFKNSIKINQPCLGSGDIH